MRTFTFPLNRRGGSATWTTLPRTLDEASADIMSAFVCARAQERLACSDRVYGLLEHNPTDPLVNVHSPTRCATQLACPIHRRSSHPYRAWKQVWVKSKTGGRGYMRRVCEHGRWVVDPDEKFKPGFDMMLQDGWQDCAQCNPQYRAFIQEQHTRISDHLATVEALLETGDFAREIRVGESLPGQQGTRELLFFPDEAVLYFAMNLAEIEHELGGG